MDNKNNELLNGFMGNPEVDMSNNTQYNIQSEPVMEMPTVEPTVEYTVAPEMVENPVETVAMPEFEMPTLEEIVAPVVEEPVMEMPEQVNEQGKTVNYEALKNLAEDTNNLVNPTMVVSPIGKQNDENVTQTVEEPKVDYTEIQNKKNYAIIAIVVLVIAAFILLLPTLISWFGF